MHLRTLNPKPCTLRQILKPLSGLRLRPEPRPINQPSPKTRCILCSGSKTSNPTVSQATTEDLVHLRACGIPQDEPDGKDPCGTTPGRCGLWPGVSLCFVSCYCLPIHPWQFPVPQRWVSRYNLRRLLGLRCCAGPGVVVYYMY